MKHINYESKIPVLLQARMSSTRLPGKVMLSLNGKPAIYWQISRISRMKYPHAITVLTSDHKSDDILANYLKELGISVYRGELNDVFDRFFKFLSDEEAPFFIRLTADCPLVMPEIIDEMIIQYLLTDFNYFSNALVPSYPDGLDVEIVDLNTFKQLNSLSLTKKEREHVTLALYSRKDLCKIGNFSASENLSGERWTLDYPEDYDFIKEIYSHFENREEIFNYSQVLELLSRNPSLQNLKSSEFRNIELGK